MHKSVFYEEQYQLEKQTSKLYKALVFFFFLFQSKSQSVVEGYIFQATAPISTLSALTFYHYHYYYYYFFLIKNIYKENIYYTHQHSLMKTVMSHVTFVK